MVSESVERILFPVAERLWPDLKFLNKQKRVIGAGEVLTSLYAAPLALAGLVWLVAATDWNVFRTQWQLLILMAALMFLFRRLGFFMIQEIRSGRYASSDGSMETMILWAAVFLVGPAALWITVILAVIDFTWRWRRALAVVDRWNRLRNLAFHLAEKPLAFLASLQLYYLLGGEIPLSNFTLAALVPAMLALFAHILLVFLIWSGYILYAVWTQLTLTNSKSAAPILRFLFFALGMPSLSHPFAILVAGLYAQYGLAAFFFLVFGLLMVAILARQLSWVAESSRQQSRQLEKLELLSRAILEAPADASSLPELLAAHVPLMFPQGRVAIWINPDNVLLRHPFEWEFDHAQADPWLQQQKEPYAVLAHQPMPWQEPLGMTGSRSLNDHHACVVTPVVSVESGEVIGGVYLEVFSLVNPWAMQSLVSLYPALLSLAGQVASALHAAGMYEQALAYQKVSQELSLAGKIQSSFLPDQVPSPDGWQIAVTLLPARETSGDFFDFIPLEGGKIGVLIADVTDKGVGAALYMALSRTLIRTYAVEFDEDPQPDVVFFAANGRLLRDARANLFVTAFYGILDPLEGTLTYCNAGHNPPYLLTTRTGTIEAVPLIATGMPMGIEEETIWQQKTVQLEPGDALIMYTDGIPDAQNHDGDFFGDERLRSVTSASLGLPAHEIQSVLLDEVQEFTGDAPQFDDITLLILARDA